MPANRRIFFPTHLGGFAPLYTTNYTACHGMQNIGINTNFTLENVQELGQLKIYQLLEQIPEIEVTAEKCLDGYPLMYHLSTQGAPDGSLIGRSNQRCMLAMSVYGDTQASASGTPQSQTTCSGLYFQQATYTFTSDQNGFFREACTWVGNDKWYSAAGFTFTPNFINTDVPLAIAGSGGVQIRRDMIFYPILAGSGYAATLENSASLDVNGQLNAFLTILPPEVGVSSSGTNDRDITGNFLAHLQSITATCNVGRDMILELGRKEPYFRFAQFPIQVTCEISTVALQADAINATELGYDGMGNNLTKRTIKLRTREGTWIDLGTENKLQTVSFQGGGTDGGQVTTTYSFLTYNDFKVVHPQDPAGFVWPY